jgi:PilZ domain-containing protein
MVEAMERRQRPRFDLPGIVRGMVSLRMGAEILNLSVQGAKIDHMERLLPGGACVLSMRLGMENLRIGAQVVWSRVHSLQAVSSKTGEGELHYHSGLRFPNLPERTEVQLRGYLDRVPSSR